MTLLTIWRSPTRVNPSAWAGIGIDGLDGKVDQVNPLQASTREGGTTRGEGPWVVVGGDIDGMGIEDLVVAVAHLDLVPILAQNGDVRLLAEIDNLFVATVFDEDGDTLGIVVGQEIDGPWTGVEIARAIGTDYEPGRVGGEWRFLG